MTITLLDIYNKVAEQAWSMFDNETIDTDDFEPALLSAINKALVEIWCSYPFEFRLREKTIFTQRSINKYHLPDGVILQKMTSSGEKYSIQINRKYLDYIENPEELEICSGKPTGFFVKNESLCFYPVPDGMYKVTMRYLTFSIGYDVQDKPIYAMREATDKLVIPEKYEQLFMNALISKALMYAIASPNDENYAGYALQYETSYKLLLKSVGGRRRNRKIVYYLVDIKQYWIIKLIFKIKRK